MELGNLDGLVERLAQGQISVQGALREIEASESSGDEVFAWTIARHVQSLIEEGSPVRVLDLGKVLSHAAALYSSPLQEFVDLCVGSRLLDLERPGFAEDFLDKRAGRPLDESDRIEWECQRLRCLGQVRPPRCQRSEVERLVEAARKRGTARQALAALMLLAEMRGSGEAQAALANLDEALRLRSGMGAERELFSPLPLPSLTTLWTTRGVLARDSGLFEEAIRSFEKARELAEGQTGTASAFLLSEIGITWQHAGEPERAEAILRTAADEARRLGDFRSATRWTGELSQPLPPDTLRSSDTLALALRLFNADPPDIATAEVTARETIAGARKEGLPAVEVMARNLLAVIYGGQECYFQARMAAEAALQTARDHQLDDLELIVLLNLGLFLVNLEYPDEAQEQFEVAVALGERLRAAASSSEIRKALTGRLAAAYEWLIVLRGGGWVRGDRGQDGDPGAALVLSQRAQAFNLAAWFALQERWEGNPQCPALGEAVRGLRTAEVLVERAALAGRPLAPLLEARNRADDELRWALEEAGMAPPSAGALLLDEAGLRRELGRGEAFLNVFSRDGSVFVIALSAAGEARCDDVTWTRDERLDWLQRWEAALAAARCALGGEGALRGWRFVPDPLSIGVAAPRVRAASAETPEALLDELAERFLAPLAAIAGSVLRADRVFLSPHRELYNLPFWALERIVPEVCFSIVPGAGCLSFLRRRRRDPGGARFKIGDCTDTLPFCDRELETLAGHEALPPRLDAVLAAGPQAAALHFAGHGLFDGVNAYNSGLVLDHRLGEGLDPEVFVADSRWLTPTRRLTVAGVLARMDLRRCRLVTLSACCTGLPHLHPASEFTSLPASFLVAGARNVIGSLWPAHDGATALLMEHLYAALDDRTGPAEALRGSRRWLAGMTREEALQRLGPRALLAPGSRPFESPMFTMAFQAYGVD